MDETTSTSSTPTAAVADGASAAAATKTATPPAGIAAATTGVSSPTSVKLLIKASNQQFDDQIIESDLMWTVKRLKTQLSLVYPSKPAVADQKLIYSGQLLNDALQLKDVIRSYKDVYTQNHIIHLVSTQRNFPTAVKPTQKSNLKQPTQTAVPNNMNAHTTASDGLRQRHTFGASQQQQQQQQHNTAYPQQQQQQHQQQHQHQTQNAHWQNQQNQIYQEQIRQLLMNPYMMNPLNPTQVCPQYNPAVNNFLNMQQGLTPQNIALYNWMQQVYAQYMDQCARFTNNVATADVVNAATGTGFPSMFPNIQQLPFPVASSDVTTNPVIIPNAAAAAAAAAAGTVFQQQPGVPQAANEPLAYPQRQPRQPALQQAAAAAAQPRFPNLVEDEAEHRDWLDSFFSVMRLAVFLTILYFNSSPLRCLAVVFIAGGIYLYHIGVLRLRHEHNNNNLNRNNNAEADQIRQGVQEVQQAQGIQQQQQEQQEQQQPNLPNQANVPIPEQENVNLPAPNDATNETSRADQPAAADAENAIIDNNRSSIFSFVRTFVITFFTSLLPETPAAI